MTCPHCRKKSTGAIQHYSVNSEPARLCAGCMCDARLAGYRVHWIPPRQYKRLMGENADAYEKRADLTW